MDSLAAPEIHDRPTAQITQALEQSVALDDVPERELLRVAVARGDGVVGLRFAHGQRVPAHYSRQGVAAQSVTSAAVAPDITAR